MLAASILVAVASLQDLRVDSRCSFEVCGWETELEALRANDGGERTDRAVEHLREHCALHGWSVERIDRQDPMIRDVAKCPIRALAELAKACAAPRSRSEFELQLALASIFEHNGLRDDADRVLRGAAEYPAHPADSLSVLMTSEANCVHEMRGRMLLTRSEWSAALAELALCQSTIGCGTCRDTDEDAWSVPRSRCLAELGRVEQIPGANSSLFELPTCVPLERWIDACEQVRLPSDAAELARQLERVWTDDRPVTPEFARHVLSSMDLSSALSAARGHRDILELEPSASIDRLAELDRVHDDDAVLRIARVGDRAIEQLIRTVGELEAPGQLSTKRSRSARIVELLARTGVPAVGEFLARRLELAHTPVERRRVAKDRETWRAAADLRAKLEFGIVR